MLRGEGFSTREIRIFASVFSMLRQASPTR
jgi:hypothetical protein